MRSLFDSPRVVLALENLAVKRAIGDVIDARTYYGFTGYPYTREFERALAERLNVPRVFGVTSGTDALILALRILGIKPGDEVIVPAFSFISTASAVSWLWAKPVFADIRLDDYALDPIQVEKKITNRTKAIIITHLFGQPALRLSEIVAIGRRYNIPVIEDAAQSLGAQLYINNQWRYVGTIGDIGCFSFSATKIFSALGSGGAIISKDERTHEKIERIRFYGAQVHYEDYPDIGVNAKLHEIHAATLLAKLKFLDYWISHRDNLARCYHEELADIAGIELPSRDTDNSTRRIWYRYVIRTKERDKLFSKLNEAARGNVFLRPTKNYPLPLPYFSAFADLGYRRGDFPVSEQAAKEVISLPISNYISRKEVKYICAHIHDAFRTI